MKVWDISIRQPVLITMIFAAGVVLGLASYFRMPVDLFPDVELPIISVTTIYPGAGPEEIENQITSILEENLGAISGLDKIASISSEGVSVVIMQFELGMSVDRLSQEVREKTDLVRRDLPDGIEEPIVARFKLSDSPIILFSVTDRTGELSSAELRTRTEDDIQRVLQTVPDVASVEVVGGRQREIQVQLNMAALEARRVAPQQVLEAIAIENLNVPAGSVTTAGQDLLVRTPGNFDSLDALRDVIITLRGSPVYLRDVATVVDGYKKLESITRVNGIESVVVSVRKQSGSNSTAVATAVQDKLTGIAAANPDLEIVVASDASDFVKRGAIGALEDAVGGLVLAFLIVLLFFRSFRSAIITTIGLPITLITTFFFMDLLGITINQLSLLAIALAVGFLVDDAIVVRENILRWIDQGYSPATAASLGTAEVIVPVIATSATILAVFLPVAYTEGIIGKFFRDFGLTVSIAVIVSTFEAVTLAPMLSARFFRSSGDEAGKDVETVRTASEQRDRLEEEVARKTFIDRFYARILKWTLDHKFVVALFAAVIIAASVYAASTIPLIFLPNMDRPEFNVSIEMAAGTPLEVTRDEAIKVESILRSHPLVTNVFVTVGGTGTQNQTTFFVTIQNSGRNSSAVLRQVIDDLRGPLATAPGITFRIKDELSSVTEIVGGSDIILQMTADSGSYTELGEQAQEVARQLAAIPGLTDIDVNYRPGAPELQIGVDRRRAGDLGLSTAQIAATLRMLISGEVASIYRGEGEEADIVVRLDETGRSNAEDILNLSLLSPTGQLIPLRSIAQASVAAGPNEISHLDRRATVSINANVTGRSKAEATADVTAWLPTLDLPPGMNIQLGGLTEIQDESFRNLSLALLLAVIFIYMVLASQFGSFVQPLLIMIAMPLAIIGAILALALANRPLDITAYIGFIMLMGLVTKNSILLVEFANRAREQGATAQEAMLLAGPIRLRPILMTALSTILAMVPVAIGLGAGGEFRSAMAIAIIGGMTTSTFLTLLMVPAAYSAVVGGLDRLSARGRAKQAVPHDNDEWPSPENAGRTRPASTPGEAQPASD